MGHHPSPAERNENSLPTEGAAPSEMPRHRSQAQSKPSEPTATSIITGCNGTKIKAKF
jgi:hypothetical protein